MRTEISARPMRANALLAAAALLVAGVTPLAHTGAAAGVSTDVSLTSGVLADVSGVLADLVPAQALDAGAAAASSAAAIPAVLPDLGDPFGLLVGSAGPGFLDFGALLSDEFGDFKALLESPFIVGGMALSNILPDLFNPLGFFNAAEWLLAVPVSVALLAVEFPLGMLVTIPLEDLFDLPL